VPLALPHHPNATSDPNVNPSEDVDGAPATVKDDNDPNRHDPNRDDMQSWVAKGQGGERKFGNDENAVKAGSMSAPGASMPAQSNLPNQ
jgi:hypothetical protein